MSGILFQINHNGSPIDRKNFLNMFSRIEHRGGDASACSHCTTGVNIDFRYPYRDIRLI